MGIIMKNGIQYGIILKNNNSNEEILYGEPDPIDGTYPPGTGITYTLRLDCLNDNPNTWGTWINSDITECSSGGGENEVDTLMGYYPCTLNANGEEAEKINFNNYTKNINGDSLVNSTRVMVKFPRRGYRIWWDENDGSKLYVSITNERNKDGYDYITYNNKDINAFYLGVYEGFVSNNFLLSQSNCTPTVSKTISQFRTAAQKNGKGFEQFSYQILTYLQCCALIKYKGKNIEEILGKGRTWAETKCETGILDDKGLNYGEVNGTIGAKLFGVEHLWGDIFQWVDGIYVKEYSVLVGDGNFNDNGEGYINTGTVPYSGGSWLQRPRAARTKMGFLPDTNVNGSDTKYFCDYCYIVATGTVYHGGIYNNKDYAGLFMIFTDGANETVSDIVGSRLVYYDVKEDE